MRRAEITAALPIVFGLSRIEAAAAVGVCANTFDEMVSEGLMPEPREAWGRRLIWDVDELRASFKALPRRGRSNTWDDV